MDIIVLNYTCVADGSAFDIYMLRKFDSFTLYSFKQIYIYITCICFYYFTLKLYIICITVKFLYP